MSKNLKLKLLLSLKALHEKLLAPGGSEASLFLMVFMITHGSSYLRFKFPFSTTSASFSSKVLRNPQFERHQMETNREIAPGKHST